MENSWSVSVYNNRRWNLCDVFKTLWQCSAVRIVRRCSIKNTVTFFFQLIAWQFIFNLKYQIRYWAKFIATSNSFFIHEKHQRLFQKFLKGPNTVRRRFFIEWRTINTCSQVGKSPKYFLKRFYCWIFLEWSLFWNKIYVWKLSFARNWKTKFFFVVSTLS